MFRIQTLEIVAASRSSHFAVLDPEHFAKAGSRYSCLRLTACANHPVVVLDLLGEMRRSRCALDAVAYATAAAACDGSSNAGALLDWLLGCEEASLQLLQS
ncbi:unnamed protein product [Symbiodinium sp. CCMP2592]|nr:unnamed protein product [Symbiodinium sp. CCMP2592]